MPTGLATAEQQRSRAELEDIQLQEQQEVLQRRADFRAPDEGMDGTTKAAPMDSPKAPHRPSPAKGAVQLKEAAGAVGTVANHSAGVVLQFDDAAGGAGGEAAPAKPPPGPTKSKGLGTKGATTDGGMDATPPPEPPPVEPSAKTKAPVVEKGGKTDTGSGAGKAAEPIVGKTDGKTAGADTAAAKIGSAVFKQKPTAFIDQYKTLGTKITGAKQKDEAKAFSKMPTVKAVMPGDAQAGADGKLNLPNPDTEVGDGVEGTDHVTDKTKYKAATKETQKVGGGDASRSSELADFADLLSSFFSSMTSDIDTEADHVDTDPGPAPPIILEGTSDPDRAVRQDDEADQKIEAANEQYAKAIDDGKGPQDVHRVELEEAFEPQALPDVAIADEQISEAMAEYEAKQITAAERAGADDYMHEDVQAKLDTADADLQATLDQQEEERAKAIADQQVEVERVNEQARADQEKLVADAKSDIAAEQDKTRKKQAKEVEKARKQGDKERRAAEDKVAVRQKEDDAKIKREYDKAEKDAEKEKDTAEAKADAEKKKAEEAEEDKGWWDSIKSAVSSVVDACCSLIGDIFDALGSLVAGIFDAVKSLANGIIDAACAFAKGVLDVLATALKGLITGLIGTFLPGLAEELNSYIDKGLDAVKSGIDAVGDLAKKGVAAACDAANAVIQKGLQVAKTGIQTAIRVAGCIATGDFEGAFMAVFYAACDIAGLSKADAKALFRDGTDLIKDIIDHPIDFIKNLMKAGIGGFKKFASGFVGFLKEGIQEWILGPLSGEGFKLPNAFNALGIFKMISTLVGATLPFIKKVIVKMVGPAAEMVFDKVMDYVDAFMEGGIGGIWEQIKTDVGDLWSMLMGFVTDFLKTKAIQVAMEKLGSLLAGPIGALWQVLSTAWSIFQTVKDKFDKLKGIVTGIFGSIAAIARGAVGGAINTIVGVLVKGLGVAIDLLAKIARLGGIPKKIKKFLSNLRTKVQGAIEKLIKKIVGKVKGLFKGGKGRDNKGKDKGKDGPKLPQPTTFTTKDGHKHKVWVENKGGKLNTRVASTPKDMDQQLTDWKKDSEDIPKESKGKVDSAVSAVSAADNVIDGKPIDKVKTAQVEAGQKKLASAAKKAFDEVSAASNTEHLPGGDYPKNYAEYVKWLETNKQFGGELKEIEAKAKKFGAEGGDVKRATQTLEIDYEKLEKDKAEYLSLRDKLDAESEKRKKKLAATTRATEAASANEGDTMPQLLEKAKTLAKQIRETGGKDKELKAKMEGVMQACMLLSAQIDPEGTDKGRKLYEKIDKGGHSSLITAASGAGVSKADQSKLAVNYRNWLRTYFRNEVMTDSNASNVLFLRDFVKTGQYSGLTWEQVVAKVIRDLKNPSKTSKDQMLRDDFTLETATPEELDKIYGGVIGSSQTTNAGTTGNIANAGKTKDVKRVSFKEGDESHSVGPEEQGGQIKIIKRSEPQDVMWLYKRGEAFQIAARIQRQTEVYTGKREDKRIGVAGDKAILTRISKNLLKLEKAMAAARGDDLEWRPERIAFEKKLGGKAKKNGVAKSSIKYMLDWAKKFMAAVAEDALTDARAIDDKLLKEAVKNPKYAKMVEGSGIPKDIGFAGAIGTDFKDLQKVFDGGYSNLGVAVQTIIGFRNIMAEEMYKMGDKELDSVLKKITSDPEAVAAMTRGVGEMRDAAPGMTFEGKGAFKERMTAGKKIAGNMEGNAPRTHARKNPLKGRVPGKDKLQDYDMDAKAPVVPIELLGLSDLKFLVKHRKGVEVESGDTEESLRDKLRQTGVIDGKGKEVEPVLDSVGDNMDPRLRSQIDKDDADLGLQDNEKDNDGPREDHAPFMAGILANLVDAEHKFIKDAREKFKMPLKAGISGNAHRFMNQAKQMGAPLPGARLAIYGHLVTIEAHSFHEVMSASLPHVDYKPGEYVPFKPKSFETEMWDLAKAQMGDDKEKQEILLGVKPIPKK